VSNMARQRRHSSTLARRPTTAASRLLLAALVLGSYLITASDAFSAGLAFGAKDYIRGRGAPVVVTDTFIAARPGTAFTLRIDNGGSHGQFGRVSSAVITLNGVVVVGPSDFNQQVAVIQKRVALHHANIISVELRSAPGSGFTLQIGDGGGNAAPIADAGPDQTVALGAIVTLDGGRSSDADGDSLAFRWRFTSRPAGSTATLSDPTAIRPLFQVDRAGTYTVELVVNDGTTDSAPDTVQISTQNSRPVANAGPDQTVPVGTTVTLDGSRSSDVDGDTLTFRWAFTTRPAGSTATLSDPTAMRPSFIVDHAGTYVVELVVNDGHVDSAADAVQVSTQNSPPVANAGPDQTAFVGTTVTLDGSGSTDVDGDALTFRWALTTRPTGSTAVLSDPAAIRPTFLVDRPGAYTAQLIVNDGTVDSAPATVHISTGDLRPVGNAGPDQSVTLGSTVTLDGSGSSDPDGDALTFRWALIQRPAGSQAALANPGTVAPTFIADVAGRYVAQLIVNDGTFDSLPDLVQIDTVNSRPVAEAGADQTAVAGTLVQLDGTGSRDADGDPLTFRWSFTSRPNGSTATFLDATAARPTFIADLDGMYVAQLIVSDGALDSAPDTTVITVAASNRAPVADAGPDQTVATGATVQLDGSHSSDPDGTPIVSFAWSLTRPAGSAATLSSTTVAKPTFVADRPGTYVATLTVGDGALTSAPDTVTITVVNGADLRIRILNPPGAPLVGSFVGLSFDVTNLGTVDATGVVARFPIPAGYTFAGTAQQTGVYDPATGNWTIGTIANGGTANLTIGLFVTNTPPHDLLATIVASDVPDPNPANNTAIAAVTANRNADLGVFFPPNAPQGTVRPGAIVGYFFSLSNLGPAQASNAHVRFKLPPGFTVNFAGPQSGTYDPATGDWIVPNPSGTGLGVNATINATGSIRPVTAIIISSDNPDPNPANNTAIAPTLNRPPMADAGPAQSTVSNTTVTLDGTRTSDADGDAISFNWTFALRPVNSAAVLANANTATPSFYADQPGHYVVQLVATDSFGAASDPATVTITVGQGDRSPVITSSPVTAATVGQPYRYVVKASDPDAGQTLTFSLPTAPTGMTVDASGAIDWTPTPAQAGPQPVTLRVQDGAGLFATQTFIVQVSSATNRAPVAADDAYSVRVNESLAVPAPGVLANDVDADGTPLTAALRSAPTNGTLSLNPDGSFTYSPHTLQPGELVLAENIDLRRLPGVTATSTGNFPGDVPENAIDGNFATHWVGFGLAQPALDIAFPQNVTVTRVRVFGGRGNFAPSAVTTGLVQLFSEAGAELYSSGVVELPGPDHDGTFIVGSVPSVRRVRFTAVSGPAFERAISEVEVIGSTLVRRERQLEVNLGQLLPTAVRASSVAGFNIPEAVIDDNPSTNWYAISLSPGEFIELIFPVDVSVTQIETLPASATPDGFGSSLPILCRGNFTLFDERDTLLFDTGVVNTPSNDRGVGGSLFTVPVPTTSGVRRVRYTMTSCAGSFFPPGFAELRVVGSVPGLTTPAFAPIKKFQALLGREAHSTPVVSVLTDDNGDGRVDTRDIPKILVPVESLLSQLKGEIKVLSGDDGRELFTLGAPDLVSPWSEIAVGDIDNDGVPDVVAVHSDGNHLIAFDLAGGVVQGDLTRVLGPVQINVSSSSPQFLARFGADGDLTTPWTTATGDAANLGTSPFFEVQFQQDVTVTEVQLFGNRGFGDNINIRAGIFQGFAADGTVLFNSGVVQFPPPTRDFVLTLPGIAGVRRVRLTSTADFGSSVGLSELKVIGSAPVATGVPKVKWISDPHPTPFFPLGPGVAVGAVTIANLDGGPRPHIIVGASVYDADGRFLGDGRALGGTTGGIGLRSAMPAVADLDLDGRPAVVAGPTAYRLVGGTLTKVWQRADRADGYVGIANFDDDPFPEIAIVANGSVYMLKHDGADAPFWNPPSHGPVPIPGGGQGGPPLIVDVDGDGIPEIGVAGQTAYTLFNRDGSVRWSSAISDRSSNATGAIAFDLDGDGQVEIIYRDEKFLRIFRGSDGVLLAKVPVQSSTWSEQPVVVDVDNDGHADIVVTSDLSTGLPGDTGVIVLQDIANKWARTRRIWNQSGYHVTNVNEDASIPRVETPHWLVPGLNGFRTNAFVPGESPDAADGFTYVATDGVLESNVATVRIAVRAANSAPRITSSPVTTAATGVLYTYGVRASDPDAGDVLAFSLPTAPSGMTIEPATGLVRWTPTAAQLGSQSVVVKVTDAHGLFAVQGYTVQVSAPVTVPNVVGQPQASAQSAVTAATLTVGTIDNRPSATTPAGSVLSQNPAAGTLVAPSSAVSLVVASGPPPPGVVPNVVGEVQINAQADILAAGFVVGTVTTRADDFAPAGVVVSQAPAAGTLAAAGSAVSLVVSLGPAHVPDVRGLAQADAAAAITAAGFAVGAIVDQTSATVSRGAVIDQAPAGGATAALGSSVVLFVSLGAGVPGDTTPPTVSIDSPADLAVITIPTDILGTATDDNFLRYTLELAGVNDSASRVIAFGTLPVLNSVLGRLDPTLLENGLYRVRLTAEDVNGRTAVVERVYRIDGLAKAGNFRLSFVDLSIPMAGIPLTVVRTYDSRVKTQEAFGIGWTLDIARGRYQHNRPPGRGFVINDLPVAGSFLPCIGGTTETQTHITEVRLSDREVYSFAPMVQNANLGITGACEGVASFQFVDGTTPGATLDILDGAEVLYLRGGDDTLLDKNAFLDGDVRVYNPQRVRLTTPDGRVVEFDATAGITRIEDVNGNAVSITSAGIVHSSGKSAAFTRDGAGRITQITDPAGQVLAYTYDARGDLAAFVDPASARTTFVYDARHNLQEIRDPLGRSPVRTEYDAAGRLVSVTDAQGHTITVAHDIDARQDVATDRLGRTTVVEYDVRGNVVRKVDGLGHATTATYDARDNLLSQTDPLGHTRTFTYDASNNVLTETDPAGNTVTRTYDGRRRRLTRTDARGGVTTFVYDSRSNLVRTVNPVGDTTVYTHDARGNTTSVTDALGNTTTYTYDAADNRIAETDPRGHSIQRAFDARNRLVAETTTRLVGGAPQVVTRQIEYDARGRVVRATDAEGAVSRRAYDVAGLLASLTDPIGRITSFTYDEQGRLVTTAFPDGTTEALGYDAEGQIVSLRDRGGRSTTFAWDAAGRQISTAYADGRLVQFAYDAAGRRVTQTDEDGGATTFAYDDAGRLTRVTDPLGGVASLAYDRSDLLSITDRNGHTTTFTTSLAGRRIATAFADGTSTGATFDALGRKITTTDEAGNTTRFEYDAVGNLTAVVDALGNRTRYAYDDLGFRTNHTDPLGNTTRWTYDRLGRPLTRTLPLGDTEQRTYDAAGNLVRLRDFNGQTLELTWDAADRLVRQALSGGETQAFTYSPTGKLATMTDRHGTTTIEYDLRDRPTAVREPDGTQIGYAWDARGNRTGLTTPAGTTSYGYDAARRLTLVQDPDGNRTTLGHDAQGNLTAIAYANGIAATYAYNARNRLVGVTQSEGGTPVRSHAYTLGAAGNRLHTVDDTGRQVDYGYDALFRLTRERVTPAGGGTPTIVDFTYDTAGNRLSRTDASGVLSYVYDANSRLLSAGATEFTYDAGGNLLSRRTGSATTTYEYDRLNRLTRATVGAAAPVDFTYDALDNRVTRTAGGTSTAFLVDLFGHGGTTLAIEAGNRRPGSRQSAQLPQGARPAPTNPGLPQVLRETDAAGAPIADYVYGDALLVSQRRAGSLSFFMPDGQSSTRLLTDADGAATDRYDYDAFGNLASQTGGTPNVYLFGGQQLEPALDLYYLRARYYDPVVGRFTSRDPFAGRFRDPASLHPYTYAANNPVNRRDPTGRQTEEEEVTVVVVSGELATLSTAAVGFETAAAGGVAAAEVTAEGAALAGEAVATDLAATATTEAGAAAADATIVDATLEDFVAENFAQIRNVLQPFSRFLPGFQSQIAVARSVAFRAATNVLALPSGGLALCGAVEALGVVGVAAGLGIQPPIAANVLMVFQQVLANTGVVCLGN